MKFLLSIVSIAAALPSSCAAFVAPTATVGGNPFRLNAGDEQAESDLSSFTTEKLNQGSVNDGLDKWQPWVEEFGQVLEISPKLAIQPPLPEERGKGGVTAKESIAALETVARIPRTLIVADCDIIDTPDAASAAANATIFSWATDLTAAALYASNVDLNTDDDSDDKISQAKKSWIQNWIDGGWATDSIDLGPKDVRWGAKDLTGTLMATGSDNDHNIYAKFRMPCHPVLLRASMGLKLLTGADEDSCREALQCRGKAFRGMRDALQTLVATPTERKGSIRERRAWDVSDMLSRVLSRATTLQLDDGNNQSEGDYYCIVPVHERLSHSLKENTKLVACDDEIFLVALRDIPRGEQITRDYTKAPQLEGDTSDGALRLLLQFGLPPNAWPQNE